MIKYLGSKRRLVPVLAELFRRSGARTAIDAFTGTTRVAQEMKRLGAHVTAVDTARYSKVFADCWIATDGGRIDRRVLADEIARLGYDPVYGARPLKRVIQQQLQNPLARELLSGRFAEGSTVQIDFDQDEFTFRPVAA